LDGQATLDIAKLTKRSCELTFPSVRIRTIRLPWPGAKNFNIEELHGLATLHSLSFVYDVVNQTFFEISSATGAQRNPNTLSNVKPVEQLRNIVGGGYCIGCGACNSATNGKIPILLDEHRQYKADVSRINELSDDQALNAINVCPFSNTSPNEDIIASDLYSGSCNYDPNIGYLSDLYIGHVAEGDFRAKGTSGGIITWLLTEMLQRNMVDRIIHVKAAETNSERILFKYAISSTAPEILAGAKSRYYPIETSDILEIVRNQPYRYAFVGLPCFVKAIRLLQREDPLIQERIKFCIGLVCGHLKSAAFADCFAWQMGIQPGDLKEIDFRVKLPNKSAGDYGVYSKGNDKEDTRPTRDLFGSLWGYNLFRNSACNFCDDVFAETADVAVGDAWLAAYEPDGAGNSVVVVRNPLLGRVIREGINSHRLNLDVTTREQISLSQAGGLRDRREGLAYRISRKIRSGRWHPVKRVNPTSQGIPLFRRLIYIFRSEAGNVSHRYWLEAVKRNDLRWFIRMMTRLTKNISRLYHPVFRYFTLFFSLGKLLSKRL
jgi:coenzyme F420 hydrogenase subunit beta